jgi:putative flippase GtrA
MATGSPAPLRELATGIRFSQFLSVGVLGAVCDNLILVGVVEMTATAPFYAKLISAEVAIVVMFILNEQWTFGGFGGSSLSAISRRFFTSNIVRAGAAGVALVILTVLTRWFGIWYLVANFIGIGVGFILNYLAESLVTWRVHRMGGSDD